MNILIVIDSLLSGGKERRLIELLKGLHKTVDFHVLVLSSDIFYDVPESTTVYTVVRKHKYDLNILRLMRRIILDHRIQIIHVWDSMSAIYAILPSVLHGIPLMNSMIAEAPVKPSLKNRIRAKISFPFSTAIVANSHAGLISYRAPLSKSYVIYNGIDLSRGVRIESAESIRTKYGIYNSIVVGMVASFTAAKDYETYILAAKIVLQKNTDITFITVGDGPTKEAMMSLADLHCGQSVRFLGVQKDIESIVNILDICVLSTFTEGISNAVLEYMLMGKPVIATEGGGTKELVVDGTTGFLIPPRNPHLLADRILTLIHNSALQKQYGENGKKRIENEFSLEKMSKNTMKLFLQLTKN